MPAEVADSASIHDSRISSASRTTDRSINRARGHEAWILIAHNLSLALSLVTVLVFHHLRHLPDDTERVCRGWMDTTRFVRARQTSLTGWRGASVLRVPASRWRWRSNQSVQTRRKRRVRFEPPGVWHRRSLSRTTYSSHISLSRIRVYIGRPGYVVGATRARATCLTKCDEKKTR